MRKMKTIRQIKLIGKEESFENKLWQFITHELGFLLIKAKFCANFIPYANTCVFSITARKSDCLNCSHFSLVNCKNRIQSENGLLCLKNNRHISSKRCGKCMIQDLYKVITYDSRKKAPWFIPNYNFHSVEHQNCLNCTKIANCSLNWKEEFKQMLKLTRFGSIPIKSCKNWNSETIVIDPHFTANPKICPKCLNKVEEGDRVRISVGNQYQWFHGKCYLEFIQSLQYFEIIL